MTTPNPDRLDAGRIRAGMAPVLAKELRQLTLLEETDSTNTAVLRLPGDRQHAHAILAERQTRGKGRRNRTWHSPAGGNIYCSLGWWFRNSSWPLSTLPLVVAVVVCKALARSGLRGHGVKWPNDILVDGRKLAGILVEMQSAGNGPALAVIGVGINIRMPPTEAGETGAVIDRPWTDLVTQLDSAGAGTERNRVAAFLLEELLSALQRFEDGGFEPFRDDWQTLDLLNGKVIELEHNGQTISGIAQGVDGSGGLVVETCDGGVQAFHSGEVSIRRG